MPVTRCKYHDNAPELLEPIIFRRHKCDPSDLALLYCGNRVQGVLRKHDVSHPQEEEKARHDNDGIV